MLVCTLTIADHVTLEPTLLESFIHVFKTAILQNEPISDLELEQSDTCIGCTQAQVDIAIRKCCVSPPDSQWHNCGTCRCRPMWCSNCLAKWTVYRHMNAEVPKNQWLYHRVPCPTCRTPFCIDDVAEIITTQDTKA
ncbi:hypothetical protein Ciccas_011493 [Cichlidogyrus casuarinus]|uniref:RING-type domain-containing protein n=1 Tax=Cichlidogyrus casuarinus TaxID=1844966 RepID=A0ABD2PR28_9PLAT